MHTGKTYQPYAIIAYGSFADGSANKYSDFDALVISDKGRMHDSSVIDNIVYDPVILIGSFCMVTDRGALLHYLETSQIFTL